MNQPRPGTILPRKKAKLPPALILGYGVIAENAIAEGVIRLAAAIAQNRR